MTQKWFIRPVNRVPQGHHSITISEYCRDIVLACYISSPHPKMDPNEIYTVFPSTFYPKKSRNSYLNLCYSNKDKDVTNSAKGFRPQDILFCSDLAGKQFFENKTCL